MSADASADPSGGAAYRAACREVDGAVRELRVRMILARWRFRSPVMARARLLLVQAASRRDRAG